MQAVKTIGLDIAKSGFQVHGVDADGQVVFRRQLKRRYVLAFFQKVPSCLVGMEACATSHHWSRELQALGHPVRLMPPADVKPYVKRQKNDATDAEAICEAVTRANMRFVATKTPEQQSGLVLHRTRHLFIRQHTAVINAIRVNRANRPNTWLHRPMLHTFKKVLANSEPSTHGGKADMPPPDTSPYYDGVASAFGTIFAVFPSCTSAILDAIRRDVAPTRLVTS